MNGTHDLYSKVLLAIDAKLTEGLQGLRLQLRVLGKHFEEERDDARGTCSIVSKHFCGLVDEEDDALGDDK